MRRGSGSPTTFILRPIHKPSQTLTTRITQVVMPLLTQSCRLLTYVLLFIALSAHASPLQPQLRSLGPFCVAKRSWIQRQVLYHDCIEALSFFRRFEANKSPRQPFEFIAPGVRQSTHLLPLTTPRLYPYKSCTISLTMLQSFPTDLLPMQVPRTSPGPATDVATLEELQEAAEVIVECCVRGNWAKTMPTVGIMTMGRLHGAIAVNVWETGSLADQWYIGGFSKLGMTLGKIENGTLTVA